MPPWDSEEMKKQLLAAMERDLEPLLEESSEALDLDEEQTEAMDDFLILAWSSGARCGSEQLNARATQREPDLVGVAASHLAGDFKALMEKSAETLNLTVPLTISMWHYLHEAWMAGNRTSEAELIALYIELKSDVGKEALEWLDEEDKG